MSGDVGEDSRDFIAALDIGTTNVRCLILNSCGIIVGKAQQTVIEISFKCRYVVII